MSEARRLEAGGLRGFLGSVLEEAGKETSPGVFVYENEVQVQLIREGQKSPVDAFWNAHGTIYIAEKKPAVKIEYEDEDELEDELEVSQADEMQAFELSMQESKGPLPLPVQKARQLLSSYTLAHNPNMTQLGKDKSMLLLPPLWVRCDGSDPEGTCWLGGEIIKSSNNKITGIRFHMVTCKGPTADKLAFANLENLKQTHKGRHHSSATITKGFVQYNLFGSTTVENSIIESRSNVLVDFTWNMVDKILQKPPLSSTATLNIQVESGDPRSPVYQVYRELDFLLVLAEGLKTGVMGWANPMEIEVETRPAVEMVQELLNDLKNKLDGVNNPVTKNETETVKSDDAAVDRDVQSLSTERGELDFTEQLWCRMRKSVSSYQDVVDCFALIIQSLKRGDVQPWIHRGSSSSLSRLIQQSYDGTMESIALTGLTPIRMFLEIGLDKMKKDYINCFIGQELATLNYLDYFISNSVDVQEQVHRVRKLHHMMEIVVCCSAFLTLGHENLFPLTQSCIKYYKENPWNEAHVFQLPIRPSVVSSFCQDAQRQMWKVEISGHGHGEAKTVWQLSAKPPVDHVIFDMPDLPLETTVLADSDETLYFTTLVSCSQVNFT